MEEREIQEKTKGLRYYMTSIISCLKMDKKRAAVHTYTCTLHSFINFSAGSSEIPVEEVFIPGKLKEYQEWLVRRGLRWNTVSTYMRTLQAVFNRLVANNRIPYNPKLFEDIYTKVEPQTKRALAEEQMGRLLHTDPAKFPEKLSRAHAYFLLMFFFRGMPFIDLAYLRKQDLQGNRIVYCRHKTGKQLTVRIPPEAMKLLEIYRDRDTSSPYLFPILKGKQINDEKQYCSYLAALREFNIKLSKLSKWLLSGVKVSSYTARHTWATLAFYRGVHVGIISKALGHSSIKVTETYLRPFENEKVDKANEDLIISIINSNDEKKVA